MVIARPTAYPIDIRRSSQSRLSQVDLASVPFGNVISDHVFVAEWHDGVWHSGRVEPYGAGHEGPGMSALNYGQSIFEGMKAFRSQEGQVRVFRMGAHWERMNRSADRMAMPPIPRDVFEQGMLELLRVDEAWVPSNEGSSLYMRPLYFATDEFIGVRPSTSYRFVILTSPANRYYAKPLRAMAETEYIRAAQGGVGEAKCAGNYGLSMLAGRKAKEKGFDVVVWLDARDRQLVEEFSTMNAFFVIDGRLVTPRLRGTFLPGITRESILTLARDLGIPTAEQDLTIQELMTAGKAGRLTEAFGTGTAATIAPVAAIAHAGDEVSIPAASTWQIGNRIQRELDAIRYGQAADRFDWMLPID